MKLRDARTLSRNTMEYIRVRAVKAIQSGCSIKEVVKILVYIVAVFIDG